MEKKLTDIETRAWVGFVKAQQAVLEKLDEDLKNRGFPPMSWYDVLLELEKTKDGRLRQKELGELILLSKYNVSRLLDRLEREGLIRRMPCKEDTRGVFAVITAKGKKLRRKMWPVYYESIKEHLLSKFSEKELEQMTKFNDRLVKFVISRFESQ
ncbi:MAG: MarR family transcriptional regulator [Candidatus Dadabacteria bacterium]|nr:MarR family transcriptional regulator [Candidatus Dadabacteria bacterium]NIV41414.1 MarR family transcriptional regulator [Candidatus Dadabacteria bacterium]